MFKDRVKRDLKIFAPRTPPLKAKKGIFWDLDTSDASYFLLLSRSEDDAIQKLLIILLRARLGEKTF